MPVAGRNITVMAQFKKAGVNTAPSPAPTVNWIQAGGVATVGQAASITDATNFPGSYYYALNTVTEGTYEVNFHTSDVTVDQQDISVGFSVDPDPLANAVPGAYTGNQAGNVLALIKAKTDLIGVGATISAASSTVSGVDHVHPGSDYLQAIGTGKSIPYSGPSLVGATNVSVVYKLYPNTTINITGYVTAAGLPGWDVPTATSVGFTGTGTVTVTATLASTAKQECGSLSVVIDP